MARKLTRDQKRKKKLAKRARGEAERVTPYTGRKYRADFYLPIVFATESAINEVYMILDRNLSDGQVAASLTYLVKQLWEENPVLPPGNPTLTLPDGRTDDLIAEQIRRNWESHVA